MGYPRKPSYGEPCNRCGTCCLATPCIIALSADIGAVEGSPCPLLKFDEQRRAHCGVVDALGVGSEVAKAIGIGVGCDSGFLPPHEDALYGMTAPEVLNRRFLFTRNGWPV